MQCEGITHDRMQWGRRQSQGLPSNHTRKEAYLKRQMSCSGRFNSMVQLISWRHNMERTDRNSIAISRIQYWPLVVQIRRFLNQESFQGKGIVTIQDGKIMVGNKNNKKKVVVGRQRWAESRKHQGHVTYC